MCMQSVRSDLYKYVHITYFFRLSASLSLSLPLGGCSSLRQDVSSMLPLIDAYAFLGVCVFEFENVVYD